MNFFQFPEHAYQPRFSVSETWAYCPSFCLRSRSPSSSSETGVQSDSASALTRGANDSIACLFAFVRWGAYKDRGQTLHGKRTS